MSHDAPQALVSLAEYREQHTDLFPSTHSLAWYNRQHRAELVKDGALVMHAGRWFAVPDRFDAFILSAAKRAAQHKLRAQAK